LYINIPVNSSFARTITPELHRIKFEEGMVFAWGYLPTYDDVMKHRDQKTKQALIVLESDDFFVSALCNN